jgi:hypothetical protein
MLIDLSRVRGRLFRGWPIEGPQAYAPVGA